MNLIGAILTVLTFISTMWSNHAFRRGLIKLNRFNTPRVDFSLRRITSKDLGIKTKLNYVSSLTTIRLSSTKSDNENAANVDQILQVKEETATVELNDELKQSFMSYAMSTILGRALPDSRDGLKPVHRRILYAMHLLGLSPDSSYRKCARIVGEVLGKFHPHGDNSVYDALVRLAQDFVMMQPLIAGHGNFGSIDNDPAAAMRYTEAKLSKVAQDILLADIKDDTVDFVSNFDGNEVEPLILPARLPLLLINGANGIAVGMATSIPPHNLGEVVDAIIALIDNPQLTDDELLRIIPAPDFPTGGLLFDLKGVRDMYLTGHGSVTIRAKTHFENNNANTGRTRNSIVITELPYMTNKAALLEKIAGLVNDKKLEGIADLRDESDRDGIRVVIDLKRDAIPRVVLSNLFKKTELQTSFSGNLVALTDAGKSPTRITLRSALQEFIAFRFATIRRRTAFQLKKLEDRLHLVEGLMKAMTKIDEIITLIKSSKDVNAAKAILTDRHEFSAEQAEAILGLTLRRLTALEENKLTSESADLRQRIAVLSELMRDDARVYATIKEESLVLKHAHSTARKSVIDESEASSAIKMEDLVPNDRSAIIITKSGYIKRVSMEEFEAQNRGGKGKTGAKLSTEEDAVSQFFSCMAHDSILFITDRGVAYSIKAYQVPQSSRTAKGVVLPNILSLKSHETITSVLPISTEDFNKQQEQYLVLLTNGGFIKRTPLKAFQNIRQNGLTVINLEENDSLRWTRTCSASDEILIGTRNGYLSRYSAKNIPKTSRNSRGCIAIKLRPGDSMADMDIFKVASVTGEDNDVEEESQSEEVSEESVADDSDVEDETENAVEEVVDADKKSLVNEDDWFVLLVTEKGYGKRVPLSEFGLGKRLHKGTIAIKSKGKAKHADKLRSVRFCQSGDEVVMSTQKGSIMRQRVEKIGVQTRYSTGMRLQSVDEDDVVSTVDIFSATDSDDEKEREESIEQSRTKKSKK